jgi:hypothetical protein
LREARVLPDVVAIVLPNLVMKNMSDGRKIIEAGQDDSVLNRSGTGAGGRSPRMSQHYTKA